MCSRCFEVPAQQGRAACSGWCSYAEGFWTSLLKGTKQPPWGNCSIPLKVEAADSTGPTGLLEVVQHCAHGILSILLNTFRAQRAHAKCLRWSGNMLKAY